jgi:hypothetical protein
MRKPLLASLQPQYISIRDLIRVRPGLPKTLARQQSLQLKVSADQRKGWAVGGELEMSEVSEPTLTVHEKMRMFGRGEGSSIAQALRNIELDLGQSASLERVSPKDSHFGIIEFQESLRASADLLRVLRDRMTCIEDLNGIQDDPAEWYVVDDGNNDEQAVRFPCKPVHDFLRCCNCEFAM